MKGRKEHHHKRAGGGGVDVPEEDLREKPEARVKATNIDREADERKKGGRAKRAHGGHVHHEKMELMKHAKHIGEVKGERAKHHAGRKPRKDGGRTGADSHPFSSARKGEERPGGKEMSIE